MMLFMILRSVELFTILFHQINDSNYGKGIRTYARLYE